METINLWSLSCGELIGKRESFLELCFHNDFKHTYQSDLNLLRSRILLGGYPEVQNRTPGARCAAWFQNYLTSIIERDIKDLSLIEGITDIPKLLVLLAARAGSLINLSDISRLIGLPWTTLKRYISLLESIYLIRFVPSWSSNLSKHVTKQPKLYFADTGLLCHLYNISSVNSFTSHMYFGHIVENFVFQELLKQISWHDEVIRIYTFRGERDLEVDLVLEKQGGEIVGIEVKSNTTVNTHDFAALKLLANKAKTQFKAGYVLYAGTARIPFGDKLTALPISALFE
jgi:predicted AAA+ superfamily ATPase